MGAVIAAGIGLIIVYLISMMSMVQSSLYI